MRPHLKRRHFSAQLAATALGLPFVNNALAQGAPSEGNGYKKMDTPVAVSVAAGKVEVVEFFSYACPHCADFEHTLGPWSRKLPAGIEFRRIPVPFLANAQNFQTLYYALEDLGLVDTLHAKVFQAVHRERLNLNTPDEITAWVAKQGIDAAKFKAAFGSFSIGNKLRRGAQMAGSYDVDGVPLLVVQGRYQTSPAIARSPELALRNTEYLVKMVRGGK